MIGWTTTHPFQPPNQDTLYSCFVADQQVNNSKQQKPTQVKGQCGCCHSHTQPTL